MARGVRFTKAEREWLKAAVPLLLEIKLLDGGKAAKLGASVLAKLAASEEEGTTVDVAPIETALIAAARGKVVALEGGFARARVQATAVKATEADAKLVGEWMARQGWLTGPQTLLDVLTKWHQWLPKARATQPPPALQPGLGTDAPDGRGPAPAGQTTARGRSAPGFR